MKEFKLMSDPQWPGPGEWKPVQLQKTGERTARLVCPDCRCRALLDHSIATDGTVTPSVVCPTEGCNFHEMVRLSGWGTLVWPI